MSLPTVLINAAAEVVSCARDLISGAGKEVPTEADEFFGRDPCMILVNKSELDALEAALESFERSLNENP